jgi:hypothetical protein
MIVMQLAGHGLAASPHRVACTQPFTHTIWTSGCHGGLCAEPSIACPFRCFTSLPTHHAFSLTGWVCCMVSHLQ